MKAEAQFKHSKPSSQYMYLKSKLLAPVVNFAKPVKTILWALWKEQYQQYISVPDPQGKESSLPLHKRS